MTPTSFLALTNSGGAADGGGSGIGMIVMFGSIFLVFWFMILRPQKKQQAQRKSMLEAVKRGDQIVTSGGLFATVRDVKGDRVVATIADGVKVEISKTAINVVIVPEEG